MHFLWIYTDAILNSCKSMLIGVLKSLENGTVPAKRNNIDEMICLLQLKIVWQSPEWGAQK
jgi:hypothetical protein